MPKNLSIVAVADQLRLFMAGLWQEKGKEMSPTYTNDLRGLDGYAIDGLIIAIDPEYTSDNGNPVPRPVFIMAWRHDPELCIVPFGKEDPLDGAAIIKNHAQRVQRLWQD